MAKRLLPPQHQCNRTISGPSVTSARHTTVRERATPMTTNRMQTGLAGLALAVAAGALALIGGDLAKTALLGVALGGAVALVPDRSVLARISGLVLGVSTAWIGYAVRAGFLPDIPLGRAIALAGVVLLVTAVAIASAGRVPLWSALLGLAAMAGAYETTFTTSPTSFVVDSTTAVTTVLVAVSFGIFLAGLAPAGRAAPLARPEVELPSPRTSVDALVEQEVAR
ncbi:MAG: hypothetical protein JWN31_289 [Frankiales bacterium]|nr:hypothetical protein [Frankiales bacterium]